MYRRWFWPVHFDLEMYRNVPTKCTNGTFLRQDQEECTGEMYPAHSGNGLECTEGVSPSGATRGSKSGVAEPVRNSV